MIARMERSSRRATWFAFLAVLLLDLAVSALIVQQILRYRALPFDLDEANHANGGLALFLGWHADGLLGFVRAFFRRSFYPPGFAWVQAIAFDLFGTSITVARLLSAASFFLAILAVFLLCVQIDRKRGYVAGVIAALLTLTAQPLLITAGQVVQEAPGLLVTVLWLLAYVRALQSPTRWRLILSGLLLTLTFLMKYSYGAVAVATMVIVELSLLLDRAPAPAIKERLSRRLRALIAQRWLWLFGPFVLFLLVWFARPGNVGGFLDYATAQPPNQSWLTADSLRFYPQVIVDDYVPIPLFGLLTLAGLVWGAVHWRQRPVRLLLVYFLVGMSIMLLNMPKDERFIATFVPAAHMLTGLMLSAALTRVVGKQRWRLAALAALVAVAALGILSAPALGQRLAAYSQKLRVSYETDASLLDIADWLDEQIPAEEPYLLVNYWDKFGPQTMSWHRGSQLAWQQRQALFADVAVPGLLIEPATPRAIAEVQETIAQSGACYLVLFEGATWGEPFWPEYTAAMEDRMVYVTEEWFEILRPVEVDQTHDLDVKVIIYRLPNQCN